eukprot:m.84223 g.84223  ORF g.84223 m.84223 type:complete len:145 (-) comp14381_c0_seq2:505-939(-)
MNTHARVYFPSSPFRLLSSVFSLLSLLVFSSLFFLLLFSLLSSSSLLLFSFFHLRLLLRLVLLLRLPLFFLPATAAPLFSPVVHQPSQHGGVFVPVGVEMASAPSQPLGPSAFSRCIRRFNSTISIAARGNEEAQVRLCRRRAS